MTVNVPPRDPFGTVAARCREIDAALDRMEHAGRPKLTTVHRGANISQEVRPGDVAGPGQFYGALEMQADVALFQRFTDEVWDLLDHRTQRWYAERIASIRRERHRHDIVNG